MGRQNLLFFESSKVCASNARNTISTIISFKFRRITRPRFATRKNLVFGYYSGMNFGKKRSLHDSVFVYER